MQINRGDLFLINFNPISGPKQGGIRPALVVQNNTSNKYSPITIVAPITSKIYDKEYPTNVLLDMQSSKLKVSSTILLNQIRAIDKKRILKKLSSLNSEIMSEVDLAIKISLDLS